jgi:two-component system, sensor histidine kinase and response regulator
MAYPFDTRNPRILIVDDNESAAETLFALLASEPYDVTCVASGKEALARMNELTPDAILLDVMMPEMNGFEVCRILKQSTNWKHIPVILLTAYSESKDVAQGLDAGADEFLSKPVSGVELRARVRSMLRIKAQYDDLERSLQLRQSLSYMIVHDLRNPLAAVMLYLQLLKRKSGVVPEQLKYLEMALGESQKMSSFLDDMLMLAKMERGNLKLAPGPVSMERMLDQVQAKFRPLADAQFIGLKFIVPKQLTAFQLDVALAQRMIENLVANALKSSPAHSTVCVAVDFPDCTTLPNGSPNGAVVDPALGPRYFRLQVIDEGPGIPPEDFERMFDQYEAVQLKEHGKPELGLELAFCRMVVEAHAGRIHAANREGSNGSIITVEI